MTQSPQYYENSVFSRCNRTELYQLCGQAGIVIPPNASKQAMIEALDGLHDPKLEDTKHPINSCRYALIEFVRDHWQQLHTQITCPMKDLPVNPKPCFSCVDQQVMACWVTNKTNEDKFEKYRLKVIA